VHIDHEGLLVAEQVGEADRAFLALEAIILRDLTARRQLPALLGDALEMAAKLDLFGQQRVARLPIFVALIGKMDCVRGRQFLRRSQTLISSHCVLLSWLRAIPPFLQYSRTANSEIDIVGKISSQTAAGLFPTASNQ
jgi:hypothetical protein